MKRFIQWNTQKFNEAQRNMYLICVHTEMCKEYVGIVAVKKVLFILYFVFIFQWIQIFDHLTLAQRCTFA